MRVLFIIGCILFLQGLIAAPSTLAIDGQSHLPFWPAQREPEGGLLLVQGPESHAPKLLTNLSELLSKRGWSVAVVATHFPSADFEQQLSTYLSQLRRQTKLKVGLIWYGDGFQQLAEYFIKPQSKQVSGLILLSAYQFPAKAGDKLRQFRFPILDMVAQFDYQPVIKQYHERQTKLASKGYEARTLPGCRHDYRHQEPYLSAVIDSWLAKLPSPQVGQAL